ncbi:MAG: hypothetical protein HY094_10205 [Candidatus Melainabacteria bacterium]|nr:hypothetical protein [Candidatus Melainabacteria bacterium]
MSTEPINFGNSNNNFSSETQGAKSSSGLSSDRTLELLIEKQKELTDQLTRLQSQHGVIRVLDKTQSDNNLNNNESPAVQFTKLKLEAVTSLMNKIRNKNDQDESSARIP